MTTIHIMPKTHMAGIDGLRAISVALVILFHLGLPFVPGGFVGVDVFFVISGYLITGIIIRQHAHGEYSLSQFLLRRVRRLLPALLLVCLYCILVASLLYFPDELEEFAGDLVSTISMVSNFHFMDGGGYFGRAAENKLLLHTWSLSVEEQFYLFYPLFLIACLRLCGRYVQQALLCALALGVLISAGAEFGYLWLGSAWWASAEGAFYFTPFRAYELIAGAILATTKTSRWEIQASGMLIFVGLALILIAAVTLDGTMYYPGIAAVVPCAGAALAILGVRNGTSGLAQRTLNLSWIRYLGRISYSLYLWHWPLIVTWGLLAPGRSSMEQVAVLLPVMLIVSAISFHFLEEPIHRARVLKRPSTLLSAVGGGAAVAALFAIATIFTGGLPGRIDPEILAARKRSLDRSMDQFANCDPKRVFCIINGASGEPPTFLLWGDSHAESLLPAVSTTAGSLGVSGIYIQRSGCVPLLGVAQEAEGYRDECRSNSEAAVNALAQFPSIEDVILASRWALYATGQRYRGEHGPSVTLTGEYRHASSWDVLREGVVRTTASLSQKGNLKLYFVEQVPEMPWPVTDLWARGKMIGIDFTLTEDKASYMARVDGINRLLTDHGIQKLSLLDYLCGDGICRATKDDFPLYRDSNHINTFAAISLAPAFEQVLQK